MDKKQIILWALGLAISAKDSEQWLALMLESNKENFEIFKSLTLLEILGTLSIGDIESLARHLRKS